MMPAGSINAWQCEVCGGLTVAIHADEGVTPMFLACRSTEGCKGRAVSSGYPPPPIPDHIVSLLAWEWYRPTNKQARRMGREMREHVRLGGLVLRALPKERHEPSAP